MTCFWDGILKSLNENEYTRLGVSDKTPQALLNAFKQVAQTATSVKWQGQTVTVQLLRESQDVVQKYCIQDGHLTGAFDPFMIVLADVLQNNITFHFNGTIISYSVENPNRTLTYKATTSHFSVL